MSADPPGAVEYKIIRSATAAFKNPAKFRAALDDEARSGWELLEKLDDSRARLRRPVSCRATDVDPDCDPYRTWVGIGETALGLWVALGICVGLPLVIAAVAGVVWLLSR